MKKLCCGGTFPFDDLENGTCPGTIADFSFASLLVPHPFFPDAKSQYTCFLLPGPGGSHSGNYRIS